MDNFRMIFGNDTKSSLTLSDELRETPSRPAAGNTPQQAEGKPNANPEGLD